MLKQKNSGALRWIYQIVKKQIPVVVFIMILSAILACAGSVAALVSRSVIDSAIDGERDAFIGFALLLGGVYLLQILLNMVCKYMQERCRVKIENSIKQAFFKALLQKDYAAISHYHSGELMNRLTGDITVIGDAVTLILPNLSGIVAQLICAFAVIFYLEWRFAVVFLAGGILVFFVTRVLRTKIKILHKKVQQTDDKTRSFWQESVFNLLAVKVFSAESKMAEKSDKLQKENFNARMRKTKFSTLANAGYALVLRAGYVFAFIFCGVKLFVGDAAYTYGTVTAIIQLVGQIQSPFSNMSGILPKFYAAIASAERLMEIDAIENEKTARASADMKKLYQKMRAIHIRNLDFAYDRDKVFHQFSFDIEKGDFVAIVGHSGIGKSTLFKLMLGVYKPNNGRIWIESEDKDLACDNTTRGLFAYVPQGNLLFSGTVRENILFHQQAISEEQLQTALHYSCADLFINTLPQGLDTVIGEHGFGLSEGQAQRLAIARAIVSGAPVLLLDEATSALDAQTEASVLQNLKQLKDITCLIVTHRKQALSICNKKINIS